MKDSNNYPPGRDMESVRRLVQHYESQTDEETIAEDEAAFEDPKITVMEIPTELVPSEGTLLAEQAK